MESNPEINNEHSERKRKWTMTNIHERKTYLITDKTLMGIKEYCEIKLWGTNITENDVRFKVRKKFISMKILRRDIKNICVKINGKLVSAETYSIHLRNRNYVSLESYLFKVTKLSENDSDEISLENLTKKLVQRFHDSMKWNEKPFAKVIPNIPPLTGVFKDGEMIDPSIDLTME